MDGGLQQFGSTAALNMHFAAMVDMSQNTMAAARSRDRKRLQGRCSKNSPKNYCQVTLIFSTSHCIGDVKNTNKRGKPNVVSCQYVLTYSSQVILFGGTIKAAEKSKCVGAVPVHEIQREE